MLTTYRRVFVAGFMALALALTAFIALTASSSGAARAPIASCGNATADGGILISDISARRASCRTARRIARLTTTRCGASGTCTVRGYTCFAAAATEELTLARCAKARDDDELYRTVRFDYGR
jgi:hypothetical protein